MRAAGCRAAALALFCAAGASGHGVMYEPPTRASRGVFLPQGTSCPGGACLWFSEGTSIGCPKANGGDCANGTESHNKGYIQECSKAEGLADPTIGTSEADKHLRTYNVNGDMFCPSVGPFPTCKYGPDGTKGDPTKHNPWRKPGSAPVADACGIAGGSGPATKRSLTCQWNGGDAPPGAKIGDIGSELPELLEKTVWVAGSEAEVAWGIAANHGGGYSYRLCPAGSPLTEACFQKMPLDFVGTKQWIQWGLGMDVNNRTEIAAEQVSTGTVPAGSQWRANPIPGCWGFMGGAANLKKCAKPQFEPKVPGLFGFGIGACGAVPGVHGLTKCNKIHDFNAGIVDRVQVPDVPPGDYVLGFRWDAEQTQQVWSSCGDVRIKSSGKATKPFTPLGGCDMCCGQGLCANCTGCLNDKTGACAYCWKPFTNRPGWFFPWDKKVQYTCLGHEDKSGGAPYWEPGMPVEDWSPGCPKCWSEKDSCTPRER